MSSRTDSLRQLEQEVGVLIRRVRRVVGDRARAVHPDLQPSSYLMLGSIQQHGPVRASVLAEQFDIDKGAISRQVKHLCDLGLVACTQDPDDRRATLLSVTDEAVRRLSDVSAHRQKLLDEHLGEWSADELQTFVSQLARYNADLDDA